MCDDLLELTLSLCGKYTDVDENGNRVRTLRFPQQFYDSYVKEIVNATLVIHRSIILANELEFSEERVELQRQATSHCIWLNHLIRIASKKGYISSKQKKRWQDLVTNIRWKTIAWAKSDSLRY